MLKILQKINNSLEAWLYHRGLHVEQVRIMVRNQVYIAGLLPWLAGCYSPRWGLDFAAGAWLGTFNFYLMAKVIQQLVFVQKGAVTALLVSFYGRLFLTALILFGLIVWGHSSVVALLAGLTTVVANVLIWGAIQFLGKKFKEA